MSDTFSDEIHENPLRVADKTWADTAQDIRLSRRAKNRAEGEDVMLRSEKTVKVGRSLHKVNSENSGTVAPFI